MEPDAYRRREAAVLARQYRLGLVRDVPRQPVYLEELGDPFDLVRFDDLWGGQLPGPPRFGWVDDTDVLPGPVRRR